MRKNLELYGYLSGNLMFTIQSHLSDLDNSENHIILVDVLHLFILSCITLVIVVTPLLLIFYWIFYSRKYIKAFKGDKDFLQVVFEKDHSDIHMLPKSKQHNYRKIYSKMIGFAVSIIVYSILSVVYMLKTMTEFNVALKEYFSFPFKVYDSLNIAGEESKFSSSIKELSFEMLLIVCVSVLTFFIIYFIVNAILKAKFEKEMESSMIQ